MAINDNYRPQTKFAKVMFLHVSVFPQGRGGMPACLAGLWGRWYPSLHQGGGGVEVFGLRGSPGSHLGGGWSEGPHLGEYPSMH